MLLFKWNWCASVFCAPHPFRRVACVDMVFPDDVFSGVPKHTGRKVCSVSLCMNRCSERLNWISCTAHTVLKWEVARSQPPQLFARHNYVILPLAISSHFGAAGCYSHNGVRITNNQFYFPFVHNKSCLFPRRTDTVIQQRLSWSKSPVVPLNCS